MKIISVMGPKVKDVKSVYMGFLRKLATYCQQILTRNHSNTHKPNFLTALEFINYNLPTKVLDLNAGLMFQS